MCDTVEPVAARKCHLARKSVTLLGLWAESGRARLHGFALPQAACRRKDESRKRTSCLPSIADNRSRSTTAGLSDRSASGSLTVVSSTSRRTQGEHNMLEIMAASLAMISVPSAKNEDANFVLAQLNRSHVRSKSAAVDTELWVGPSGQILDCHAAAYAGAKEVGDQVCQALKKRRLSAPRGPSDRPVYAITHLITCGLPLAEPVRDCCVNWPTSRSSIRRPHRMPGSSPPNRMFY